MDGKEKLNHSAKLTCTRQKIENTKKKILNAVESLLEPVSSNHLIDACKTLSQADYADVIEERNILNLCGYPLCEKKIKLPQQKYKIDYNCKKVYDITARKCFCSNTCYKASNFLKSQLLEIPVWFQEESAKVTLLQDCHNKGSAGEEVFIHDKVSVEDFNSQSDSLKDECKKLLLDDLAKFADDFRDKLVVVEKDTILVKGNSEAQTNLDNAEKQICKSASDSDEEETSTESDDGNDKFYLDSKDELHQPHKLMPVASAKPPKPAILITPLPLSSKSESTTAVTAVSDSFFTQMHSIFTEWITLATYQFLLCEDGLSSTDIERLFNQRDLSWNAASPDLSDMQDRYLKICMKLDKMEEEDREFEDKVISGAIVEEDEETPMKDLSAEEKLAMFFSHNNNNEVVEEKSPRKIKGRKKKSAARKSGASKANSVRSAAKNNQCSIAEEKNPDDIILPMVDSVSQNSLRRQVVISKLRIAYLDLLLPLIGLHYKNISDNVRFLVTTFSFSPTNILFRPSEWNVISLVLFRMLKRKFPENYCSDVTYQSLLEKASIHDQLTIEYVDSLIRSLIRTC